MDVPGGWRNADLQELQNHVLAHEEADEEDAEDRRSSQTEKAKQRSIPPESVPGVETFRELLMLQICKNNLKNVIF